MPKNMKICIINNLFTPDQKGGVETVVKTIAWELEKQKHQVLVICAGREKQKTTMEKINNIKIYRVGWDKYFAFYDIDEQNLIKRFLYRIHQLHNKYSASTIRSILKKEKPQLILTHNTLGLGYNIIKIINQSKIKHLLTLHDVQLIVPSGQLILDQKINFILKIYAWFTKNLFKNCQNIISPSEALLNFYLKRNFFSHASSQIIPNPISKPLEAFPKKEFSKKELKILYIGQLEEHKGVMDLIRVFKLLDPEKFSLSIAGRGKLSLQIKNISAIIGNLDFYGEYNFEQRIKLLNQHDLIVVPSVCFENAPMVILEAWQQGVPALVSNFGGLPELIEKNKNGWIFRARDVNNLKEKLEEIYKNQAQLGQMSKYCLEKVRGFEVKNYIQSVLRTP